MKASRLDVQFVTIQYASMLTLGGEAVALYINFLIMLDCRMRLLHFHLHTDIIIVAKR